MKKIFVFLLFSFFILTSNAQVGYTIKLNNTIGDYQQVKYIQDKMYQIFDNMPQYNDTINTFTVKTSVDINLQDFSQKMLEFGGYIVVTFNKNLIVIEKKDDETN